MAKWVVCQLQMCQTRHLLIEVYQNIKFSATARRILSGKGIHVQKGTTVCLSSNNLGNGLQFILPSLQVSAYMTL